MQPLAQSPLKIVERQGWLLATQLHDVLFVYRSVTVLDSDSIYQPVAKILEKAHEVLFDEVFTDDSMMFGKAQWAWYRLGEI